MALPCPSPGSKPALLCDNPEGHYQPEFNLLRLQPRTLPSILAASGTEPSLSIGPPRGQKQAQGSILRLLLVSVTALAAREPRTGHAQAIASLSALYHEVLDALGCCQSLDYLIEGSAGPARCCALQACGLRPQPASTSHAFAGRALQGQLQRRPVAPFCVQVAAGCWVGWHYANSGALGTAHDLQLGRTFSCSRRVICTNLERPS